MNILAVIAGVLMLLIGGLTALMTVGGIVTLNPFMVSFPLFYSIVLFILMTNLNEDIRISGQVYATKDNKFAKFLSSPYSIWISLAMSGIVLFFDFITVGVGITNSVVFADFAKLGLSDMLLPTLVVWGATYYHYRMIKTLSLSAQ
jgi:hypothetical protein